MSAASLTIIVLAAVLVGALLGFLLARIGQRTRRAALRDEISDLAGDTLRDNSDAFLKLARESLGREQTVAQASLREREIAIAQLVQPLKLALERTDKQVAAIERDRVDSFATLRTQIESITGGQVALQRETRNLVTALRRPEVRGRWGEMQLRRVVELAGLSEHCDFTEQLHVPGERGAARPDMVVHMPDNRDLVVDAKTPLDAYLEAIDAPSEELRNVALVRHAQQVNERVRELASRAYWDQFASSPEFAVLFLPGDQFLSAALAQRPELLDEALGKGVILATPSTLMAVLKAVAYGWRQSKIAENAETLRDLGQDLYRRLATFGAHLTKLGDRLNKAVESYNGAVGSLERNVLPQARRFTELGVTAHPPLPNLESIERLARTPDSDP
ncbi:MAG: DNA recombination protein RmuC [Steroidobacteraceae bacterium]